MELMEYAQRFSFDKLTPSQKEAVLHKDGALLILAGPGSGKTRVITCRIAQLIDSGVSPYNICAITFTNKAAEEMRQRVHQMGVPYGTQVSTFHSLCVRILREFAEEAGMKPNFSIYSDADQKKCVKDAIADCDVSTSNFTPAKMLNAISRFKNDLESPDTVIDRATGNYYLEVVAKVYKRYQELLKTNNALDFDDLLTKTAFLLKDRPDVRKVLGDRFRYILVDEYQDTNHSQYQIAKGIALEHGNICVTGDPDQSIYRWRGADIGNILEFEQDWPNAKVVRLEENFRSSKDILQMADKLIANNTQRKDKKLIPTLSETKEVVTKCYPDEQQEAEGIAIEIKKLIDAGADLNEIAVLYRVNSMSRALEEVFVDYQIPYVIVRGVEFYSRKEIRDMVAYLKLIANTDDNVALARIINTPARGIGKTTVDRLEAYGRNRGISAFAAAKQVNLIDTISKAAQGKILKFAQMIDQFSRMSESSEYGIAELMDEIFKQSGMSDSFAGDDKEDTARENIEELINAASKYDEQAEEPSLLDYLQTIALYSDSDAYDPESGCVSLMSLHAAKGLEFENAFIIGLEEGILPHERSKDNPEELEEERRLFFVGITRAKMGLHVSYSKYRSMRGMLNRTIPSKFLYEIGRPPESSFSVDHGWKGELDSRKSNFTYGNSSGQKGADSKRGTSNYSPKPKSDAPYSAGDLVKHAKFGLGRIKEYLDLGEKSVVTVRFNSGQTKSLMVKYAKLEKVG